MGTTTLTITASSTRPNPLWQAPTADTIEHRHPPACKNPVISIPNSPGDTMYDNDVLHVVQLVAERRKLRAHDRAQHLEERRDLVKHVPCRGCDADEVNNGHCKTQR